MTMPTKRGADPDTAGVLVVDKPEGVTSHDVVARLRRVLGIRRIGHAGTLDPMATGVLVTAVGRGTRLLPWLQATGKSYTATVRLGLATTTDDRTGEPLGRPVQVDLDEALLDAALGRLTGVIEQRPSAVSAVKVDGRRAYDRVRAGEDVVLPARQVRIDRFVRVAPARPAPLGGIDVDCEVDCGSGTYVRALARDLGAALAIGGHLVALRRTAVGPFDLAGAVPLPEPDADREQWLARLIPLGDAATAVLPRVDLDAADTTRAARGQGVDSGGRSGRHALVGPAGDLVAVAQADEGRWRWDAVFASA